MTSKVRHLVRLILVFLIVFSINTPSEGQDGFGGYSDLLSKVQSKGSISVIVKLKVPFSPEEKLSAPAEILEQRSKILESQNQLLNFLSEHKVSGIKKFKYIPYIAMEVDSQALSALISNPLVESIQEDILASPMLHESSFLINADDTWSLGYTGSGWAIAVLDTGVDKSHSFFSNGKVVSEACFSTTSTTSTTLCPNGLNTQIGSGAGVNCSTAIYGCDHGTHVAGIAAGKSETINGIAKDANIISIQVFSRVDDPTICGLYTPCLRSYTSDQIRALEHVYSLRTTYNIASVNMSIGGGQFSSYCDSIQGALKSAIDNLRSVGIATVVASGNNGYCNAISSPACISSAVSVGATTKTDIEAGYSNYSPFLSVFAPGSFILSSVFGNGLGYKSGTSMAAPHVSGAWAILKQKFPSSSVSDVLNAFQNTGVSIPNSCAGNGHYPQRRIDIMAAMDYLTSNQYTVTANAVGNGTGTVSSNVGGISYSYPAKNSGSFTLGHGANVVLTATAGSGSSVSWTTCTGTIEGDSNTATCTFSSLDGSKMATATFTLNQHTLTVTKAGTGKGTVVSRPAGINCGIDCTELYNHGVTVTLTATPTDSIFTGWSGDCSSCGTNTTCNVTMNTDKACVATFSPIAAVKVLSPNGGEIIPSGSTYQIRWEVPATAQHFTLRLSTDGGRSWSTIVSNVVGDSYDWTVPKLPNNRTKCLIMVIAYNENNVKIGEDKSDAPFTIEVIKIVSPNGWETLTSGNIFNIQWITNQTRNPVSRVELSYTLDGGRKWYPLYTYTGGNNPGSYDWIVPTVSIARTKCKIRVIIRDSMRIIVGSDESDYFFTISP